MQTIKFIKIGMKINIYLIAVWKQHKQYADVRGHKWNRGLTKVPSSMHERKAVKETDKLSNSAAFFSRQTDSWHCIDNKWNSKGETWREGRKHHKSITVSLASTMHLYASFRRISNFLVLEFIALQLEFQSGRTTTKDCIAIWKHNSSLNQ